MAEHSTKVRKFIETLDLPTGPAWERAKAERLWFVYVFLDSIEPGGKRSKRPAGGRGWNTPDKLMTFDEAAAKVAAGDHHTFGYYITGDSALTAAEVDVKEADVTAEDVDDLGVLGIASYQERSISGRGVHVLLPRPPGADFTYDPSGSGPGFLGKNRGVALTFNHLAGSPLEIMTSEAARQVVAALQARATQRSDEAAEATAGGDIDDHRYWFARLTDAEQLACAAEMLDTVHIPLSPTSVLYDDWYKVGMALKRGSRPSNEAEMLELWKDWSERKPGHDAKTNCEEKWESFDRNAGAGRRAVTIGTLIADARERGWNGQGWADKANTRRDARFREALQRLALRREERDAQERKAQGREAVLDFDYRKGRVHLRDLLLVEVPPIPWRVVDFIGSGLTVLMGLPKVGKSYLLLQLAEAVGSGKPFMGWETRQGRVLYFAIEDGPDITVRRMQVMGLDPQADVAFEWEGCITPAEAAARLASVLEGDAEVNLVVIDTFRYMTGVLENASLNAAEKDFLLMRPFKELADAAGVAILATFHEKKRDGDPFKRDMLEAVSGSNSLLATAEGYAQLVRRPEEKVAQLRRGGRNLADSSPIMLEFNPDAQRFQPMTTSQQRGWETMERLRNGTCLREIVRIVTEAGGSIARQELRTKLMANFMPDTIKHAILRGVESGLIRTSGQVGVAEIVRLRLRESGK